MWSHLPLDTIAKIFSFLSPDSLACAASVCMPLRNRGFFCYICNPSLERWYILSLEFILMSYELASKTWKELNVPMANQLEFASLVCRKGLLLLVVGGACKGDAWIWELGVEDKWVLVERVPSLLGKKIWGSKRSWSKTKCVGSDEAVYLYREFGSQMLVWRESSEKGRWEWFWIEGCGFIKGEKVLKFPIKGMLLQPSLNPSLFSF
ncbi:hypothetical protein MKW98_022769 [Papaver atlanticum]|uniref:F-box domain-containing protein n=1 Tax=Papaver atlanticum TaxID=357466 RepID=A0AAD4TIJ9_9MAGN|nr:hypothetical protein MKW98_022769 [Papaver atlanticum]